MSKVNKRPVLEYDTDESIGDTEEITTVSKKGKFSSSGSSSEESDLDWTADGGTSVDKKKKTLGKRSKSKKSLGNKKFGETGSLSSDSESNKVTNDSKSPSSSGSSDSEDEMDSSSDNEPVFDDGLGDDLTKDEEDRQKLALMTEAEREQEFFKRHEQREALKARFEVEMKLRMEKKQERKMKLLEKKSKKRQRSLRTKEPKQNKTTRAIVELKATRNADKQKKAEAEKKQQTGNKPMPLREPLKASEVYSDSSDDTDSSGSDEENENKDDDDVGEKSLSQLKHESNCPVTSPEQLSSIKISRFRLEKWVHMPFFADIIKGCYVRVGIGQHEGRMVYRICEVVGVHETPKVYSLGSTKTNKGLKMRFGVQERVFRMEYVSNSSFTDQEFTKWKDENEAHNIRLPTLFEIDKKAKEIEKSKTANLKEEDIDKIIQEKQKFQKNPHNYALTKNRLLREKEIAEQTGSADKASTIAKQLEELEERAEELDRQRSKSLSAISYINERNRQRNVERAEEALKKEMATIKDKEEDPFTRRKCMPRLVTFGKDLSTDETDGSSSLSQPKDSDNLPSASKNGHSTVKGSDDSSNTNLLDSTSSLPNEVDDLFTAHDFDINIDLPSDTQGPSVVKTTPKSVTTPRGDGPRRSLNLSDYKKRRGLI